MDGSNGRPSDSVRLHDAKAQVEPIDMPGAQLPFLPLADLLPLLEGDELDELIEDGHHEEVAALSADDQVP